MRTLGLGRSSSWFRNAEGGGVVLLEDPRPRDPARRPCRCGLEGVGLEEETEVSALKSAKTAWALMGPFRCCCCCCDLLEVLGVVLGAGDRPLDCLYDGGVLLGVDSPLRPPALRPLPNGDMPVRREDPRLVEYDPPEVEPTTLAPASSSSSLHMELFVDS